MKSFRTTSVLIFTKELCQKHKHVTLLLSIDNVMRSARRTNSIQASCFDDLLTNNRWTIIVE